MPDLLFNLLALFTVACALGVVFNQNAVASALCLLLCLVGVAGLFALLDAFLLAVLMVFVYAGAVVALFLFIIMLLDVQGGARKPFGKATVAAGVFAAALLATGVMSLQAHSQLATSPAPAVPVPTLKNYAELLFTQYLLPVQVVGFLLLIAMLGVIVLSKKLDTTEDAK
jgi:NADH-quinone oxidoreductase subunit J